MGNLRNRSQLEVKMRCAAVLNATRTVRTIAKKIVVENVACSYIAQYLYLIERTHSSYYGLGNFIQGWGHNKVIESPFENLLEHLL